MELLNITNVLCFLAGIAVGSVAYHITIKFCSESYKVTQKNVTAHGDVAGRDIHKQQ